MWVQKPEIISCVWERLYLESCWIYLWKCQIFSKYHWHFSNYVWWNYRSDKNRSNKKYSNKNVLTKNPSINFYIFLIFLLITIVLLIAVSIYYYLIKYRAKQKHLLPYHNNSNKLKEIDFNDKIYKRVIHSKKQT